VASVRSCQKLPPCPTEPVPAGSRIDPPLAKAKPISDGGSSSGTTYLRRGEKLQRVRGVRPCERHNSADTKASEAGGGTPGARAEIPLQSVEKTMVRQAVPLQSVVEQISTCSPLRGLHARAGGCLKEAVTPWGA